MRITAEQWSVVSRLFDEALEVPDDARPAWLDALDGLDDHVKALLRSLLDRHARIETSDFLGTLPFFEAIGDWLEGPRSAEALPAGTVIGPYIIEQQIGHGGMGQVWLAEQTEPVRRRVALKLIRAGNYDSSVVKRFQSERQSLAIMDHPAIAKVFDAGATAAGQPYLVMEYVDGLPITDYCDRKRLGDSVGRWQGDTLIVDTVARTSTEPLAPRAWFAMFSDRAHFTERLRLVGSDLEDQLTIEDPIALAGPWQIVLRFKRLTEMSRMLPYDCTENDRNPVVDGKLTITNP